MASGIGKPRPDEFDNCCVCNEPHGKRTGNRVADSVVTAERQGRAMVISIVNGSRPVNSYVRCPSCQVRIRKVGTFISRMTWYRFRCTCGYDGPMEYIATAKDSGRKLRGA